MKWFPEKKQKETVLDSVYQAMEIVLAENTGLPLTAYMGARASGQQEPTIFEEDNALVKTDFEAILALDFDPETFSTTFLNDPTGTMDSFLSKFLTPSQSHSSLPNLDPTETATNVGAEIRAELHSVLISDDVSNFLK